MIEGGTFKGSNFIDLVSGHYPTEAPTPEGTSHSSGNAAAVAPSQETTPAPSVQTPEEGDQSPDATMSAANNPGGQSSSHDEPQNSLEVIDKSPMDNVTSHGSSSTEPSTYGPLRRRVGGKSGPAALFRPPGMLQDDVVELLREVVPRMIEANTEESQPETGHKRTHEEAEPANVDVEEPPTSRPRTETLAVQSVTTTEVLSIQEVSDLMTGWQGNPTCEALVVNYLQKKTSKEIPPSNNEPTLQKLVDESKGIEWQTLIEKGAIKIHYGKRAETIKRDFSHPFIGSRFVITRKPLEENQHVDPNDPIKSKADGVCRVTLIQIWTRSLRTAC